MSVALGADGGGAVMDENEPFPTSTDTPPPSGGGASSGGSSAGRCRIVARRRRRRRRRSIVFTHRSPHSTTWSLLAAAAPTAARRRHPRVLRRRLGSATRWRRRGRGRSRRRGRVWREHYASLSERRNDSIRLLPIPICLHSDVIESPRELLGLLTGRPYRRHHVCIRLRHLRHCLVRLHHRLI